MRRLSHALRSLALVAALTVATLAWRYGSAPPHVVLAADGTPLLHNGRPVVRQDAAIWVQLAIMVISSLLSYALAPKPPKPKPAALEDFDIPQAVQGAPFAMIFGECRDTSPVVAWFGNLTSKPIKAKGKK